MDGRAWVCLAPGSFRPVALRPDKLTARPSYGGDRRFFCKGPESKYFRLCRHTVSATTTQLSAQKQPRQVIRGVWLCSNKPSLLEKVVGWTGPAASSRQDPCRGANSFSYTSHAVAYWLTAQAFVLGRPGFTFQPGHTLAVYP